MSGNSKGTALFFAILGFVIGVVMPNLSAVLHQQTSATEIPFQSLRLLEEEEEEEEDENPALEYTIIVCIVLLLILLTILFEYSKDELEESVPRHVKPIVESLFGELTVLGFLSIFTFVVTKAGWFMTLGERMFGPDRHEELLEVFESVHFTIFFIMVFFVIQVLILVKEADRTSENWLEMEKQVRSPDIDWAERATEYELSSTQMTVLRWMYSYITVLPHMTQMTNDTEQEHVLLLYKALRDEFVLDRELDYPFSPSEGRIEEDFNFARYLGVCQASLLTKVVHVKISTWVLFSVGVIVYDLFVLLVHGNQTVLSWTWVAMAWFLCIYNIHFERHLIQVLAAFSSKGVYQLAHHGQQQPPDNTESTGLLENEPDSGDHLLPDWCRVDIEHYLANRPYLPRCFAGGVPNRQQALYWMDRKGPPLYLFILQFDLLFVGIFAAIQFTLVGPYMFFKQPHWEFALYVVLATLPILNLTVNKRRLVALLTPVSSLGFYRRPQIIATVIQEEKTARVMRTFITVYKLRRFAMQAEPAQKERIHYRDVFDQHEIEEVGRTFDDFDLDGGGSITMDEFETLMGRLGAHLSQEQLKNIVASLDTDKSGGVDRDEFIQWYADQSHDHDTSEEEFAEFMFHLFDCNDSGELTIGEFKKKLEHMSSRFTLDEISMLINELDANNGGTICKEEFEHLIHKYYPKELQTEHH